jgi:3-deoxy-D-manno-octulosonic-acid transferase
MRHLAPKALVIAETEIWPNMIMAAGASHVPVIIINARLSTKAFKRYLYVKPLIRHLLAYTRILAMGSRDYLRFKALGADNVSQAGNIKFDAVTKLKGERADTLKKELAIGNRPVFIAGSIRSGEEALVVASIEEIRKNIPEVFCIVAPRHHDRISFVTCAATDRGMTWSLRSEGAADADILILDTTGELFDFYGLSTVAFVGGSLVKSGGQNPLEPIAWSVPTLHGPHMDNFLWAMEVVGEFTITVRDESELAREAVSIISHPELYRPKAEMARDALDHAKGATKTYCNEIMKIISY